MPSSPTPEANSPSHHVPTATAATSITSAMTFPDCVLLPTYWGFACASSVARHRAVECSLRITRTEYRDKMWEKIQVRIDDVGTPYPRWLERGHPPSPQYPRTTWKRGRNSGAGPAHDSAQPSQQPAFVHPPDA